MKQDIPTVDAAGQLLPPKIPGVEVKRLTTHADHRGVLTQFIDTRDPFWNEPIVYAYRFSILPGRIKGWGMHRKQTDRYFIVSGNVRVVLYEPPNSGDIPYGGGIFEEIYFTDATPGLVKIPPGIWHADQNWGGTVAHVCNFPTVPYDPADPDKYRISPDSPELAFDWSLRNG